jgi:hypothetical protein
MKRKSRINCPQMNEYLESLKNLPKIEVTFVIPSSVTPENYYRALSKLQNDDRNINSDIVSFTALMDWDEKIRHYIHYYQVTVKAGV